MLDAYYNDYNNCRGMKKNHRLDNIYYNNNNNDNIHISNILLTSFIEGFSKA